MKYNFDRPIDRTREISIKWSPQLRRQMFGADDVIPMGIADMDFETAPAVAQAIRAHVQACYDREAALTAALDAGQPYDIEAGWPS